MHDLINVSIVLGCLCRYCQVGNAVPFIVARALGYTLAMAFQKQSGDESLMKLPAKFSHSTNLQLAEELFHKADD